MARPPVLEITSGFPEDPHADASGVRRSADRGGPPASVVQVFVLGIDPGVSRCGYGCVEASGSKHRAVAMGVLRTPASDPLPKRLAEIQAELRDLITEYRPEVVAVERVFFQTNVRTAMSVGQASGLAMAEAHAAGCDVVQYTPNEVKQAVAGWGGADKEQMITMVQSLLFNSTCRRRRGPPTRPMPLRWRCATWPTPR